MTRRRRPIRRIAMTITGIALIAVGIPVMIMPTPFGAAMIAAGTVLLLNASPYARRIKSHLARRYPATARRIAKWRGKVRERIGL